MNPKPHELISEKKLTEILQCSDRTLRRWRQKGIGPVFIKIANKQVLYYWRDIDEWLNQHRQRYNEKIKGG